jgi:hypothetical protein
MYLRMSQLAEGGGMSDRLRSAVGISDRSDGCGLFPPRIGRLSLSFPVVNRFDPGGEASLIQLDLVR